MCNCMIIVSSTALHDMVFNGKDTARFEFMPQISITSITTQTIDGIYEFVSISLLMCIE